VCSTLRPVIAKIFFFFLAVLSLLSLSCLFPICWNELLSLSVLFSDLLFLSQLGSVIVILKRPFSFPPFSLCLSYSPSLLISSLQICFTSENLLFSLVFLPALTLSFSHSVFSLHHAWEDFSMFFCMKAHSPDNSSSCDCFAANNTYQRSKFLSKHDQCSNLIKLKKCALLSLWSHTWDRKLDGW